MNMSSRRYINAASEYLYMCTLICYIFRSAAFYKDPPLVIHALAQELSPQKVNVHFMVRWHDCRFVTNWCLLTFMGFPHFFVLLFHSLMLTPMIIDHS